MEAILAPLAEDKITKKMVSKSDGEEMNETLQVGEQIEAFRKVLATEEAELKLRWKRWDKIQQELVELGVEVLGEEATGYEKVGKLTKGYAAEKAVWDAEFNQQLQGPEEELEAAGKVAIEKLTAAEKVRYNWFSSTIFLICLIGDRCSIQFSKGSTHFHDNPGRLKGQSIQRDIICFVVADKYFYFLKDCWTCWTCWTCLTFLPYWDILKNFS